MHIQKLISGGQTGADRAALDWAIKNRIEHGGWCPKGRLAEDGPIHSKYQLTETPTAAYAERTEWNVRDSDGTIIFSVGERLAGGSLLTREMAIKYHKPHLHLCARSPVNHAEELRKWVHENRIRILNVAGPRASDEPEIGGFVTEILDRALLKPPRRPS